MQYLKYELESKIGRFSPHCNVRDVQPSETKVINLFDGRYLCFLIIRYN